MSPRARASLLAALLLATAAGGVPRGDAAQGSGAASPGLRVELNRTAMDARVGDVLNFTSNVTAPSGTGPLLAYMSLVDLGSGMPVDLEDWAAHRSADVPRLAAGQAASQAWTLRAILRGDYVVYVVVIPNGTTGDATVSPPLRVHIAQRTNLDPGGVLPVVAGAPLAMLGLLALTRWSRRAPRRNP